MTTKSATKTSVLAKKKTLSKKSLAKKTSTKKAPAKKTPAPFISTGYWLLKSEPESYSIQQFEKDGHTLWTGVRNYQARNFMMTSMKHGDSFLFYHSNAVPSGAIGTGTISKANQPDPTAQDSTSDYYDAKASHDHPIWFCAEVKFASEFAKIVSLAEIRANPKLAKMALLAPGQRLSVLPVSKDEFEEICTMGGTKSSKKA